jgi:hypothetical protein
MAHDTTQFASKAQQAAGSMLDAMQGLASIQTSMLQRLSEVQQALLRQAAEAANEQLQLLGRVKDPREFAIYRTVKSGHTGNRKRVGRVRHSTREKRKHCYGQSPERSFV